MGSEINVSKDFLLYLQSGGIQSAYRRRARETHPDLIHNACPDILATRTEEFRTVSQAYELLKTFLQQREAGIWQPFSPHPAEQTHHQPPKPPKKPATTTSKPGPRNGRAHNFQLPRHRLAFGLYLFHRGIIPRQALIKALVWQRRQRPNLGNIANRWGWLSPDNIQVVLTERTCSGRFGEKAVQLNLLSTFQVKTLLRYQRSLQKRLGGYFVEQGYFSNPELKHLLLEFQQHNHMAAQHRF